MAEKVFYTGEGVFNFDGKDYGFGKALPGGLPPETVAAMLKNGKASRTAPTQVGAASTDGAEALRDQLGTLKAQLKDMTDQRDQAGAAARAGSEEIGRLQGQIADLERTGIERAELITTLTSELDAAREALTEATKAAQTPVIPPPPAAPVGGAGPKK